jgi:hypothetical protein
MLLQKIPFFWKGGNIYPSSRANFHTDHFFTEKMVMNDNIDFIARVVN